MFLQEKVLQEILYLLSMNGDEMDLLKLMKELYLIDRESIKERDSFVSGDEFFSLRHGPVLSYTLNMLNNLEQTEWKDMLGKKDHSYYSIIQKLAQVDYDLLSEKDKEYIEKVSGKFKDADAWELVKYTHTLKEWSDPGRTSRKIHFSEVMRALGKDETEIRQAKAEYDFFNELARART